MCCIIEYTPGIGTLLNRRQFLTRSFSLIAAPLLGSASTLRGYSTRVVDLVAESNVIDMLGLLTLNWSLLDRWHQNPDAFTDIDFRKIRSSGIDIFHPAVALGTGQLYDATRTLFETWKIGR